jgi:hypothetical protein
MSSHAWLGVLLAGIALIPLAGSSSAPACCPAPPGGQPVVNADQTVIIIWDAAAKMQHFIRQASFKSDADDFGFIVPSPSMPELDESGNGAFPYLAKLTEPEVITKARPTGGGGGCGCAALPKTAAPSRGEMALAEPQVTELLDKKVAGFHAKVLEAKSAEALVGWLKEHGYAFSPEIEAWARPYVEQGWKFIALQVAKEKEPSDKDKTDKAPPGKRVSAAALRISFKTDRPLFPYREPDTTSAAKSLAASSRLLRIYFIGDGRFKGELTKEVPWTGRVAWSNELTAENKKATLDLLNKLPENTGPTTWWLTEFEDNWPYRVAPADVYFSKDDTQAKVKRDPIIRYVESSWPTDISAYAIAAVLIVPPLVRRLRRKC